MTELAKYEAMIVDSGSKLTKQRRHILNIMLEHSTKHFSAESLYELVKTLDDSIGIATVYRTLDLFENLKIVRTVKIKNDGIKYYDFFNLNEENHFHHHLICTTCNEIMEIADEMDLYESFIKKKYGFEVTDHELIFHGVCQNCRQQ